MSIKVRVLHVASEAMPFVKTGGLADVLGSLAPAQNRHGCDARVVIPGYRRAIEAAIPLGLTWHANALTIEAGGIEHRIGIGMVTVNDCCFYLLACNELFDRNGIYGPTASEDYEDNARRYTVFCKAALALCGAVDWRPHIVHAHDWQAGLIPVLLERGFSRDLPATRSVFTIHNIAYQGAFWHWDIKLTGLDWSLYNPMHLEHYGRLNLLKAGIIFCDRLTTVSRRYAEEIQEPEYGFGLEQVIRSHRFKLVGIANGIDTTTWNPRTDPHLPVRYGPSHLSGKHACKRALQNELGLPESDVCLVGVISRLVEQKGIDLIIGGVDPYILDGRMQLVVLGDGHTHLERGLRLLQERHPGQVCFWSGYNEGLAHRIEGGADLFLMPSRFEPCGLNQMYSLRYGTLPLVRYTGGLADMVRDLSEPMGNGFTFGPIDLGHFSAVLDRALGLYQYFPDAWLEAVQRAMGEDHSWDHVAGEYVQHYRQFCLL